VAAKDIILPIIHSTVLILVLLIACSNCLFFWFLIHYISAMFTVLLFFSSWGCLVLQSCIVCCTLYMYVCLVLLYAFEQSVLFCYIFYFYFCFVFVFSVIILCFILPASLCCLPYEANKLQASYCLCLCLDLCNQR